MMEFYSTSVGALSLRNEWLLGNLIKKWIVAHHVGSRLSGNQVNEKRIFFKGSVSTHQDPGGVKASFHAC